MNNIEDKIPSLVFIYPSTFPQQQIDEDLQNIQIEGLDLKVLKRDTEAFAAFEWIIPTAFGLYILKPYFDSFLSEAGKDHYTLLKKTLKEFIKKGKQYNNLTLIAPSQSSDKLSTNYSQSLKVSFEFQTFDNRHIKLLFDDNLDLSDWETALAQMLELLDKNFTSYPNDNLTLEIEKLNTKQHRVIYVIINPETKQLKFNDDGKMMKKYKHG